jgi:hypothetical protein
MFLVKIRKNNTIYEGVVGSSGTPAWVIIGAKNNNLMTGYSMDGINWTTKPFSLSRSSLHCVACNDTGSLWLIGTDNGLVSSTDGINWTANNNSTLNVVASSYWSKEKSIWINVGYNRSPFTGWTEASIEYSTDGTKWTKCLNGYGAGALSSFHGVTYNNSINGGTWIAVGRQNINGYNPIVVYSQDGKNWSQHQQVAYSYSYNAGGLQNIESLGNNGFIAVGSMQPPALISPNGENWNSVHILGAIGMPSDVIYYNNIIILAGTGVNCIAYSSDNGASFTGTISSINNTKDLRSIASSKDKVIACGYYNDHSVTPTARTGILAVSTNGTTWTEQTIPDLSSVTYIASNPNYAAQEEAKINTAKTEAIAAANAAITAARDAVSVANTGGSSTPEMDAKTAANKAEAAAKASLDAANSAATLQAAINAKAAADKAKADADNAKKSAKDAIAAAAAAAASSLAEKKEEITKNLNEANSIVMNDIKEILSLTETTEPFVVNSGNLSSGTGTNNLFDKFVYFFSPFKEGFTSSDQDLFADVKLKVEKSRAIIAKIPLTNDNINEALKLSLEALTEARTIRTNLLACNSTPRPTIKFTANAGAFPVAPANGSLYWTTEGTKNYLILSKKDASIPAVDVESTLKYCARKDKFIILYDSNIIESRKFIQYKIISSAVTNTHVKYEVVIISNTSNFSKDNITNGQAVYISTNNSQTEIATDDGKTASNPCTDPNSKTFANCKPVCIPTDPSGNIIYRKGSEGTKLPDIVVESRNQWMANYYEYRPVKGIRGDGSVQYFPMDPSKTFVGPGTKCIEPCPPQDTGGKRPGYCRSPDRNWGEKPDKEKGEIGKCPTGCMKVDDPTSRRNTSACKYDKIKGHTCGAVCDFNASSECKKNTDCANCEGSEYITQFPIVTQFPIGWTPSITRRMEETYSRDDCNRKCKKATVETCRNFLELEQSGMYLESRCRRIGTSGKKVICGPISNKTQTGLVSGYDLCITCKSNKDMYAYFEFDKKWNPTTKQWDFINIREISTPSSSWFEGDVNSFSEGGVSSGGGAGSGAGRGGVSSGDGAGSGGGGAGANLRGSKPSGYQEDRDTRDARDSRDMGKIQSGNKSKSISINSASQNAKRQEMSAKVSAMKIQVDKMTNEYNSLEDNVKWNKMQMDKAEKDCYDINVKLRAAISDYTRAETISIRSGATIKEKNETEAANTRMYEIKQKAREICENYDRLKDKYMKSVNEMNSLKVKISDLRAKYNTASASVGGGSGGGGSGGSFLSPIINIFFGDDANRDCSGQLGCGNGIDYSFPSPFNSSVGGKFTPQPFESGIRL